MSDGTYIVSLLIFFALYLLLDALKAYGEQKWVEAGVDAVLGVGVLLSAIEAATKIWGSDW